MKNITQKIVSLFTVAFTVTFNVVATTLLSFNDAGAQTPSFTTSAVGPYTIATRLPVPGSPAGFDYLSLTSGNSWFLSYEEPLATFLPFVMVTAIPVPVYFKKKATELWTVYVNEASSINFNLSDGWRVDIWDSQAALISNPWLGNVRGQWFQQPDFGSLISPVLDLGGATLGYQIGFDITDTVLDKGKTYYMAIRIIHDSVYSPPFSSPIGGIAESLANIFPGTYVQEDDQFNNFSALTNSGFFGSTSTQFATPAYKMEAIHCPLSGAPC